MHSHQQRRGAIWGSGGDSIGPSCVHRRSPAATSTFPAMADPTAASGSVRPSRDEPAKRQKSFASLPQPRGVKHSRNGCKSGDTSEFKLRKDGEPPPPEGSRLPCKRKIDLSGAVGPPLVRVASSTLGVCPCLGHADARQPRRVLRAARPCQASTCRLCAPHRAGATRALRMRP